MKETVLITGGAGNIGGHTAKLYAEKGLDVIIVDSDVKKGKEIEDKNRNILFYGADLTDIGEVDRLFKQISFLPNLNHLVNLAGGTTKLEKDSDSKSISFEDTDFETVKDSINKNLLSHMYFTNGLIPKIKSTSGDKSITFVSSINALGDVSFAAYSVAKGGLISLTQTLAGELGQYGVRVNCISPGTIPSPMKKHDKETLAGLESATFLRRVGRPEEIAQSIYAMTHLHTFMSGHNLVVDGGLSRNFRGGRW